MPLARYFCFVGGVLLALLFVVDGVLPKMPVADRVDADLPTIRIHTDRKWPEPIVFDTSVPTIVAETAAKDANGPAPMGVADVSPRANADAFAMLQSPEPKHLQASQPKPKPQRKYKIARKHFAPPMMLLAQQPRFGFFGNTW